MDRIIRLLLFLLFVTHFCSPAKILLFAPALSNSHLMFYNKMADVLANAGHETWLYMAQETKESDLNLTQFINKAKPYIVPALDGTKWEKIQKMANTMSFDDGSDTNELNEEDYSLMDTMFSESCDAQLSNTGALSALRAEHFDIAIGNHFHLCWLGIADVIGVDSIAWSQIQLEPKAHLFSAYGDEMTFYERAMNIMETINTRKYTDQYYSAGTEVFRKHIRPDYPDLQDLAKEKVQLYIMNGIQMLEFPAPNYPNFIFIGGIGLKKGHGVLNEKWSKVYNDAKSGVIFVSFGSVASAGLMPDGWKATIIQAAQQMPSYTFIWKYDSMDIYAHPKTCAFVTHGGQNSLLEACISGVPVLMVPLFGDQFHNAALAARRHTIGLQIENKGDMKDRPEVFLNMLKALTNDKMYKSNAERLSKMLIHQPENPEKTLVQWINFLAEFKTLEVYDSYSKRLNLFQQTSLDVIAVILGIFHFILLTALLLISMCCKFFKKSGKRKTE